MAATKQLLIIDDNVDIGELIAVVAEPPGYACRHATTFGEFQAWLAEAPDGVMVDLMMLDVAGTEVLRYLAEQHVARVFCCCVRPIAAC